MKISRLFSSLLAVVVLFALFSPVQAVETNLAERLSGRILLQVEDKGQAWYVNPLELKRYYLGRPDDAFALMRELGLGISETDYVAFAGVSPRRLSGRILLRVEAKGQAYYVSPLDLRLRYLGRPDDAFALMRELGLGISNSDLGLIPSVSLSQADSVSGHSFSFKYNNLNQSLALKLSPEMFLAYQSSPKVYTYSSSQPPADLRDAFYGLFLKSRPGDDAVSQIVAAAKAKASINGWGSDQALEYALALVQFIPYDQAKLDAGNTPAYYPYETLYLNRGVCSDKTFLAVAILRAFGYGAAILDLPDINHTALGISCPKEYSLNGSGYCYLETTNYFPVGVIPRSINGQAQAGSGSFSDLFNPAGLGRVEIKQASTGLGYGRAHLVRQAAESLRLQEASLSLEREQITILGKDLSAQEAEIARLREQLDAYYNSGQSAQYNQLVPTYNSLVKAYNEDLAHYRDKLAAYNQSAQAFNQAAQEFFQQP